MIITGYQGIGKSTLASRNDKIIDLESGSFWKEDDFVEVGNNYSLEKVERSRPKDWYVYYCQMAQHLSRQGYIVFVSCHQEVREYLMRHNEEKFCAIFPSPKLKEDWIKRLEDRYNTSGLDKDLRALEHARKFYDNAIGLLWYECQYNVDYYHDVQIINNIDYDLGELVNNLAQSVEDKGIKNMSGINDLFKVSYKMNLERYSTDYLTEEELGHEIARLMRYGACDVNVVIFDSKRIKED